MPLGPRLYKIRTAKTFFSRLTGLMGRKTWPSGHQGIYFPRCRSVHTFFTFLEPDILFVDSDLKVLKIFVSAVPWRLFVGPRGSVHCLELPPGSTRSLELKVGDSIRHFCDVGEQS